MSAQNLIVVLKDNQLYMSLLPDLDEAANDDSRRESFTDVAAAGASVAAATVNPFNIFGGVDRYQNIRTGIAGLIAGAFANMDGPVAYGEFKIENPLDFLANPDSLVTEQTRRPGMTGDSDYELVILAKPLTDNHGILPPAPEILAEER